MGSHGSNDKPKLHSAFPLLSLLPRGVLQGGSFEPFQAVFGQIRGDYERFQPNIKHFRANLSDLSGSKSEWAVKGGEGRC